MQYGGRPPRHQIGRFIVWQSFSGLLRKENGCSVFRLKAIYRSLVSYISDWDHIIYDAKSLVSYIGDWNQGSKDAELCSGIGMQAKKSVNSDLKEEDWLQDHITVTTAEEDGAGLEGRHWGLSQILC